MTSKQESAARRLARATGQSYTRMRNLTAHRHPAPDLSTLADLPYACGRPVELELAAVLVGACRAGCRPCQDVFVPGLCRHLPTVAALSGAVYGLWPVPISRSPAALAWYPLVRQARESGDGSAALAALEGMSTEQVADVLDGALDHWAAGGADVQIVSLDPEAAAAGEDTGSPPAAGPPAYDLFPGMVNTSAGPLPILILEPRKPGIGVGDLETRCGWARWDMSVVPDPDPAWRVRLGIATRTLDAVVHIDDEGWDDIVLGEAAEHPALPGDWWDLVDQVQHVLLCGPGVAVDSHATPAAALAAAAAAGPLAAVTARVRFW
ncbi:hypothetical protein DQ384_39385 [Sphaerisporangium album]|uniref:Uncharacterized protein n=1 Tax=Sphaerisporangium album TaxID=509200 RepID=A0A367EJH7_9ACTN|nr:hypothetical protein [Sphaerisporangium album]RCG17909.1 hypothetical protein DQ384_39385 [Sphaerisporangium album]